ncbi:acetate kinase [Amycolatopsis xylanica]|uniref:Acetate kinase n=1 Tax=Amycolatopsis xylanica TaxID=589385 RepID=A0A1H2U639_9PSEU|nr:acetate/propionate family kinase [Amycolatopsis xylanica]SDW50974.1 acetate kinase [Amycolatopsis xylanica]
MRETAAKVLTVNAGSSSMRAHVVADGAVVDFFESEKPPDAEETLGGLRTLISRVSTVDAVAHRIVHGGPDITRPTRVDTRVRALLDNAASLAPLHMPQALALLDFVSERLPAVPQVVCPDTAFHRDLPERARAYALPESWRARWGLRRYGFHGISYGWALGRACELLDRPARELNLLIAHLSGGSSACAVSRGRSVDTTMGFTPLEGLMMSKRSGSVDPGLLLWLLREHKLTLEELETGLQRESGLLGLSGTSGDTRDLVRAAHQGDVRASFALATFQHRAAREIAAVAASLPSVDALVFTGDIGWDQPEVTEAIATGLGVLGIRGGLDSRRDADAVISEPGAAVPVLAIRSREELQLASLAEFDLGRAGNTRPWTVARA